TATGTVTGIASNGVDARNYNAAGAGDLTVSTAAVTGAIRGIFMRNAGTGATSVITTGTVTGIASNGVDARNYNAAGAGDLTVSTAAATGGAYGIFARNVGTGALSVTATGTVTGTTNNGVDARNYNAAGTGDLTVSTAAVTGGAYGIFARNVGTSALSVTATGTVMGNTSDGIRARNNNVMSTNLTVSAAAVTGNTYGIYANNAGTGPTNITVSGAVMGTTQAGIATLGVTNASVAITLAAGADVNSGTGVAITNDESDATVTLQTGSKVTGEIRLGDGSDNAILAGGDFSAVTVFDGGDDTNAADGFIDRITLQNTTATTNLANFINWEQIIVDGGSVTFTAPTLDAGDGGTNTFLSVTNGGSFIAPMTFGLNGHLMTSMGGRFVAEGGGAMATINGNVTNNGIIDMADGAVGDRVKVNGDFSGNGSLLFDTALNADPSATDHLEVTGDTAGTHTVGVNNAGGTGDVTTMGIELISVDGNSDGQFNLDGTFVTNDGKQAVVAGAFAYTLEQGANGSWNLISSMVEQPVVPVNPGNGAPVVIQPRFQPGAPIFEAFPELLHALNNLPWFRQRINVTLDEGGSDPTQSFGFGPLAYGNDEGSDSRAIWTRLVAAHQDFDPDNSSTRNSVDITHLGIETGLDVQFTDLEEGALFGGLMFSYYDADTQVRSIFGNGSIDSEAFGIGASLSWLSIDDVYVDAQVKYSSFESNLTSNTLGALTSSNDGDAWAFSLEAGQTFHLSEYTSVTPHARIYHGIVDFDTFTDPNLARVSAPNDSLTELQAGLTFNRTVMGANSYLGNLHALANISYAIDDNGQVNVSGAALNQQIDEWSFELGVGGNVQLGDNKTSLFGDITVETGLNNPGDNIGVQGSLGLSFKF
ncbi:MAG: autotransporter outer membrane beta-barrel domain-containing protein, partial [Pseudomonadota bacterium]